MRMFESHKNVKSNSLSVSNFILHIIFLVTFSTVKYLYYKFVIVIIHIVEINLDVNLQLKILSLPFICIRAIV